MEKEIIEFIAVGLKLLNIKQPIPVRFMDSSKRSSLASTAQFFTGYVEIWVFLDNLKKDTTWTWQEAIAHELIHVRQCTSGDMTNIAGRMLWKGKDCTDWYQSAMFFLKQGITDVHYKNLPWEEEAFSGMKALAREIQEEMNVSI